MAEHTPFKRRVEGSNPSYLTKKSVPIGADFLFIKMEKKNEMNQESWSCMDELLHARVDALLEGGIRDGIIPGACVGIYRAGETLLEKSYGFSDKEHQKKLEKNALFRIFSMTKPVTAMAMMILLEQGKVSMTDSVDWYLPEFQDKLVAVGDKLVPQERPITVQDLLTMTSGLPYPGGDTLSHKAMDLIFDELQDGFLKGNQMSTRAFSEKIGKEVPLLFQPGERWEYGVSADILGALLEVLCQKNLDEVFQDLIFRPLEMEETGFWIPEQEYDRLADLYTFHAEDWKLYEEADPHLGMTDYKKKPGFLSGGAGLISTLSDYAKFTDVLAGQGTGIKSGVRLIGKKTFEFMRTAQLTQEQKISYNWPELKGYSYGSLVRVLEDPVSACTLAPKGEFGWDGWTGPYFCISPEDETVILYLIQVCGGSKSDIVKRLRNIVYGTLS